MSVPSTDLFLCLHMFVPDTNGFLRKGTVIPRAPDYKHAGISLFNAEHGKPLRKGLLFFCAPVLRVPICFFIFIQYAVQNQM